MPDLGLSFAYGIDAAQFAARGSDGVRNLGYSATATLDIPVWDWLTTQRRIKQSEIRRDAVRTALGATQRRLIASLDEAYAEAATPRSRAGSLVDRDDTRRPSGSRPSGNRPADREYPLRMLSPTPDAPAPGPQGRCVCGEKVTIADAREIA